MQNPLRVTVLAIAVLFCTIIAFETASAQQYPSRPVKLIVPYPPGGTGSTRPLGSSPMGFRASGSSRLWSKPAPARAGNLAAEISRPGFDPDGYTLLSTPQSPLVVNQHLAKLDFDPADFTPVILINRVPNAVIVGPSVQARNLKEFIDFAKANPGKLTSATQGIGTSAHLITEMIQSMAGIKLQLVPYRGSAPALNDLLAGTVDVMFDNLGSSLSLVQSGKLRLLALTSPKRRTALPDVPTVAELLPAFESDTWNAIVAPPNTPKAIINKINADAAEVLRQPQVIEKFQNLSGEAIGGSPRRTPPPICVWNPNAGAR